MQSTRWKSSLRRQTLPQWRLATSTSLAFATTEQLREGCDFNLTGHTVKRWKVHTAQQPASA